MALIKNLIVFLVEDDIVYAEDIETGEYGEGKDEVEAYQDLQKVLDEKMLFEKG